MKRNLRFIWLLIKMKLSRMMVFRFNFFMVFFADGTLFLMQLLAFEAIYSQVDSIGGWNRGQTIIFVGTFSIINALNMLVYFFGIVDLPDKIKRGELDQYLTKPVSPLLRLTFENINPGSGLLVVLSVMIVMYGVSAAGINVSFILALGYTSLVLLMTLLWYDLMLIIRSLAFLVLSAEGIQRLVEQFLELNLRIPGVLYKGIFKILFYFLLPYGIMSTIPTQFITHSIGLGGIITALAIVVFFTAFAIWLWKFGLKNYKSAGS